MLFYNRWRWLIVWLRFGNNFKLIEVWNELTKARCHRFKSKPCREGRGTESMCHKSSFDTFIFTFRLWFVKIHPISQSETQPKTYVDPHAWYPDLCFIPWDKIFDDDGKMNPRLLHWTRATLMELKCKIITQTKPKMASISQKCIDY